MKLLYFVEGKKNISEEDMICLLKDVKLNKYNLLSTACSEWIKPIQNDEVFCEVEWNFMQYWFHNKGFTENDYRYIEACEYERDQFTEEVV